MDETVVKKEKNMNPFVSGAVLGALIAIVSMSALMMSVPQYNSETKITCNISLADMQTAFSNAIGGTQANPQTQPTPSANPTATWKPNDMNEFAQCLASKGFTMYGAYWCPHCANMKALFGDSFKYIKYVECDLGNNTMNQECTNRGITGFPTFKFGALGNQTIVGEQTLQQISTATGCA